MLESLTIVLCINDRILVRRAISQGSFRIERECGDRKSTRLNSSHVAISYAVFCLKNKTVAYLCYASPSHSLHYTLYLHDALPICGIGEGFSPPFLKTIT